MRRVSVFALAIFLIAPGVTHAQRYTTSDGRLRVALAKQPFSPTGISSGPNTMANGGIQQILEGMGVVLRIDEAALTADKAVFASQIRWNSNCSIAHQYSRSALTICGT